MAEKIAVCWDIDGVLVDTEPLHQDKINAVANAHGIVIAEKDWSLIQGIGDKRVWEWLRDEHDLSISQRQFLQECEEYYLSHPEKIIPRDGAKDAFDYFSSLRLPQCAVSSGIKEQVDINLQASGLSVRMLFALNADDVTKTKPDPEPYLIGKEKLCRKLGWQSSEKDSSLFIAIEDSIPGITAAKRAGMTTILWAQEPGKTCPEADYTVYTREDFLNTCKRIAAPEPALRITRLAVSMKA